MSHSISLLARIVASLAIAAGCAISSAEEPKFESQIRPILREYCLDCHGATETHEGSLDLRLVRLMVQGGDSGPALVAGNPDASLILQRIESDDMPPGTLKVSEEKKKLLRAWIESGAPTNRPEPETIGPGIPLTDAERAYWAYRPVAKPSTEIQIDGDRIRNGIDQVLAQAMPQGLRFSPDAPREALVRRVFLDLIGLPPSDEQFQHWMQLAESNWYEQLVDSLLQSPHYGERWARHWLDAVGYADSDGATLADAERPWAWRYRDYVIASLNQDKPIDRFILEQLAGDELAGPKQGDWTPTQIELLTATGFLRMTADGTASGDNSPEARNKTIADTLQVIGSTLLGSSLNCAQCHDHRYDPLSHEDYFALRAVLAPALDPVAWKTPSERLVSLITQAEVELSSKIEMEAQAISAQRATKEAEFIKNALDKELMKFEEPLRTMLRSAYESPVDKRTEEQKMLLDKHPSVNISPGVLYQYLPEAAEELKKFDATIAETRAKKPAETFLQALSEPPGHLPVTKLLHRGDLNQPTREISPGKLSVLVDETSNKHFNDDDPSLPTSGRRLAFAKWLTQTDPPNPLFVRAMVNRVWMHHFGKAIVATPGDFGKLGSPPTHPQLLDWLALDWIEHGWSFKHLHRRILLSTAYRQSSIRSPTGGSIDPDNRFYGRRDLQRIDAEVLRDSVLALSGELKPELFGAPIPLQEDEAGQVRLDPAQPRRSLYAKWRRTQPVALLQAFDAPVMGVLCESRPSSTVAPQSLMMMNNEFLLEQSEKIAKRVISQSGASNTGASNSESAPQAASGWQLPTAPASPWRYGTGTLHKETGKVEGFSEFSQQIQGRSHPGVQVPDATTGWVFLTESGGHPGNPAYPAIRRWIAPESGTVEISGSLSHGSQNGDGVIGSVSSKLGQAGSWRIQAGSVSTAVANLAVEAGDAIDLVLECGQQETSDSFTWTVKITLNPMASQPGEPARNSIAFDSAIGFRLQQEDTSALGRQIIAAWKHILHRFPADQELAVLSRFVPAQLELLYREPQRLSSGSTPTSQVLTNICHMLLNSNEFLYVD